MKELKIFENKNLGGYVYIIDFGSMVKIGSSNNPKERISRITTYLKNYADINSFGFKISVKHVNFRENEFILHDVFSKYRVSGTELFNIKFDKAVSGLNKLVYDTNFEAAYAEKEKLADELIKFCKSQFYLETRLPKEYFEKENLQVEIQKYERILNILKLVDLYVNELAISDDEFKKQYYKIINNPDGSTRTTTTTKMTGKGQIYFTNKFLNDSKQKISK